MTRALVVAAAALVVTGMAAAAAGDFVALPSPLSQLSAAPPLSGGATASAEGFRHRVDATTTVAVAIDGTGTPFRVRATQRLDVRVKGDYFFTIGAPLLAVEAAPGSASTPGFRATSVIWAGFNPSRRMLAARATLVPETVAPLLPLRVRVGSGAVTLTNVTAVEAGALAADAVVPPLRAYFAHLRADAEHDRIPTSGGASVTTKPVPTKVHVVVPLRVRGTIGARRVDAIVEDRPLVVRAAGAVRLTVTPVLPRRLLDAPVAALSGRALLARVTRASLALARLRQYQTFLGNPDPTGPSETTYVYRTAARPTPPAVAAVPVHGRDWATTFATAAGVLLALAGAAFAWSRS